MDFFSRLKGITSGEVSSVPCPPPRKRSNSVPMPKIEVTLSTVGDDEDPDNEFDEGTKSPVGSVADPSDPVSALSMSRVLVSISPNIF
jgi:hypothetical protein